MDAINNLLAGDFTSLTSLAILLAVFVVAIIVLFWLYRLFFSSSSTRLAKNRQPRLSLTDAAVVDDKRRLVLVRRDDVEHLVMIGGPSDIVIERNIVRAAPLGVPNARYQQAASGHDTASDHSAPKAAASSQTAHRLEPVPNEPAPEAAKAPASTVTASAASATVGAVGYATSTGQNGSVATPPPGSSLTGITNERVNAAPETNKANADFVSRGDSEISEVLNSISVAPDNDMAPAPAGSHNTSDDDLVKSLENELGSEHIPSGAGNVPEINSHSSSSKTEDEMQRLLDELTSEKR